MKKNEKRRKYFATFFASPKKMESLMFQEVEKNRLQEDPGWFKSIQGNAMYTKLVHGPKLIHSMHEFTTT